MSEKICSKCDKTKPISDFYKRTDSKSGGYRKECKECLNKKKRVTSERWNNTPNGKSLKRNHLLKKRYGIDSMEYERLLKAQRSRCAICFELPKAGKRLVIDHDHSCCPQVNSCGKCIRGLLCRKCNVGIGLLGDSALVLQEAMRYLEDYGK